MTLVSSIHYGVGYSNAFWDGTQMNYGDGDGAVLVDFTASDDVIGHEPFDAREQRAHSLRGIEVHGQRSVCSSSGRWAARYRRLGSPVR